MNPQDQITLNLPAQAVQLVIESLGQRPYAQVHALIAEIVKQANNQPVRDATSTGLRVVGDLPV